MENNVTNGCGVQSIDATYSKGSDQCQVDWGWDGSAGTVAQLDDWPIVLAVDLACTGMNRKSMVAYGGAWLYSVLNRQSNRVVVTFRWQCVDVWKFGIVAFTFTSHSVLLTANICQVTASFSSLFIICCVVIHFKWRLLSVSDYLHSLCFCSLLLWLLLFLIFHCLDLFIWYHIFFFVIIFSICSIEPFFHLCLVTFFLPLL